MAGTAMLLKEDETRRATSFGDRPSAFSIRTDFLRLLTRIRRLRRGDPFGFRLGISLGSQHAFFHDALDLEQRLVLDLADALLGDADDLADFLQRQRAFVRLLPVEAATDDRL